MNDADALLDELNALRAAGAGEVSALRGLLRETLPHLGELGTWAAGDLERRINLALNP